MKEKSGYLRTLLVLLVSEAIKVPTLAFPSVYQLKTEMYHYLLHIFARIIL